MNNGWEGLLALLPPWLKREVDKRRSQNLQEIRLRLGQSAELILSGNRIWLERSASLDDLNYCINAASRYSPWLTGSSAMGYLASGSGHRIGICGEAVLKDGVITGMRTVRSLCIRVARDITGIAGDPEKYSGSILILGAPGWGKTTLLRDLIRRLSRRETVAVVDERGELFPPGFAAGMQTDVLSLCPKAEGILQVLKTMGPQTIAVDEITEEKDCMALAQASGCGVRLVATAHAGSMEDFNSREVYRAVKNLFETVLVLRQDQTYQVERMVP